MQADPTRLAEILSRIDAEIAANEQATPGSPGLQPAAALASIRERIEIVKAEISHLQTLPVPGDDLEERIERYVEALAARGEPVVQGIGNGQPCACTTP